MRWLEASVWATNDMKVIFFLEAVEEILDARLSMAQFMGHQWRLEYGPVQTGQGLTGVKRVLRLILSRYQAKTPDTGP